jgi:IS30 family transposase
MRRRLPRKTDLATISLAELDQLSAAYNRTPRKRLGFRTPAQVFSTAATKAVAAACPIPWCFSSVDGNQLFG